LASAREGPRQISTRYADFEGEFRVVRRNLTGSAIGAEVGPYQACGRSIEDRTKALPRWSTLVLADEMTP